MLPVVNEVIATGANVVFVECGVNDINSHFTATQFNANYRAYLNAIKAGLPSAKIACVGVWLNGEFHDPDSNDTVNGITDFNTIIAGIAYDVGAYYLDIHTAVQAYEAIRNTPAPGVISGILTVETPPTPGIHPNAAGVTVFRDAVLAQITLNW